MKYKEMKSAADNLLKMGALPKDMKCAQLHILLLPLKLKEDGPMPTRKKDILEAYEKWSKRACPLFYEPNDVVLRKEENNRVEDTDANDVAESTDVDKDVLEAMMTLGAVTHV